MPLKNGDVARFILEAYGKDALKKPVQRPSKVPTTQQSTGKVTVHTVRSQQNTTLYACPTVREERVVVVPDRHQFISKYASPSCRPSFVVNPGQVTTKYGCLPQRPVVRPDRQQFVSKYASPSCRPSFVVNPGQVTTKYGCLPQRPVVKPDRKIVTRYACPPLGKGNDPRG